MAQLESFCEMHVNRACIARKKKKRKREMDKKKTAARIIAWKCNRRIVFLWGQVQVISFVIILSSPLTIVSMHKLTHLSCCWCCKLFWQFVRRSPPDTTKVHSILLDAKRMYRDIENPCKDVVNFCSANFGACCCQLNRWETRYNSMCTCSNIKFSDFDNCIRNNSEPNPI